MADENLSNAPENQVVDDSNQNVDEVQEVVEAEQTDDATEGNSEQVEEGQEESPENNTEGEQVKKKRPNGLRRKVAKLEAKLAEYEAKQNPVAVVSNEKPKLEDYPDLDTFIEALAEYKAGEVVDKKLRTVEETKRAKEVNNTWNTRLNDFKKVQPDYDDVISEYADVPFRREIVDVTSDSEIGPQMRYYLATNPEVLEQINNESVSSIQIIKKLALIESQLQGSSQVQKPAVKVTKSPAPITPVKKTSTSTIDLSNLDTESYVANRLKQKK